MSLGCLPTFGLRLGFFLLFLLRNLSAPTPETPRFSGIPASKLGVNPGSLSAKRRYRSWEHAIIVEASAQTLIGDDPKAKKVPANDLVRSADRLPARYSAVGTVATWTGGRRLVCHLRC
jgi:hypothetical protein